MRAADADRHQIAEHLKAALDEGRLTLGEYDDRVGQAYAARTYAELMVLVTDLPAPGLSAAEVQAKQDSQRRREARKLPTALAVLWTIWAALTAISLMVWVIVGVTTGFDDLYFWPAWMTVPGVALGAVTVGVRNIRKRR
jgi:hypothetical protein